MAKNGEKTRQNRFPSLFFNFVRSVIWNNFDTSIVRVLYKAVPRRGGACTICREQKKGCRACSPAPSIRHRLNTSDTVRSVHWTTTRYSSLFPFLLSGVFVLWKSRGHTFVCLRNRGSPSSSKSSSLPASFHSAAMAKVESQPRSLVLDLNPASAKETTQ